MIEIVERREASGASVFACASGRCWVRVLPSVLEDMNEDPRANDEIRRSIAEFITGRSWQQIQETGVVWQ